MVSEAIGNVLPHLARAYQEVAKHVAIHPEDATECQYVADKLRMLTTDLAKSPLIPKIQGKLKPGVADYHYEDPQTVELRELRDGPKETPSN